MVTSILRLPAVKARTGLSRRTIYLRISDGIFPKPVSLGGRAVGWVEADINEWLDQKIEHSRKASQEGGGKNDQGNKRPRSLLPALGSGH